MPARVIRPTQTPQAAPFAYTIGTTEGLTAAAVTAEWDGSGAGGDFLPCCSYYNAQGVLLDRAFPDGVTLSPGDTAEVSYRPFKRGGGGGGGGADPNAVHYGVHGETGAFIDSRTSSGPLSFWDQSGQGFSITSGNFPTPGFVGIDAQGGETAIKGNPLVLNTPTEVQIQDQFSFIRFSFFPDGSSAQRMDVGGQYAAVGAGVGLVFLVRANGQVAMPHLPTADPGITGWLWNDLGTVKVSP